MVFEKNHIVVLVMLLWPKWFFVSFQKWEGSFLKVILSYRYVLLI